MEELREKLQTAWVAKQIYSYEEIDSTNVEAARLAKSGSFGKQWTHGTLITADAQTAGRGRRGRIWESPKGNNLFFSLLLKPAIEPDKASMLTLVMALSVVKGIEEVTKHSCAIKWPNDIVMSGKKVCGILTEMELEQGEIHHVVIGTGINVNMTEFPKEISEIASSIACECGKKISHTKLLAVILEHFEKNYETFMATENLSGFFDDYEKHLINKNKQVKVLDPKGPFEGLAEGITVTGELLVQKADGTTEAVYAGEVSVRGLYGYV